MTCDPKTARCQFIFALSLSLVLVGIWNFYRLPASILPILIFLQWLPLILKSGPISLLGRAWSIAAAGLLLFGVFAGIVLLLLGS